MKNLFSTFTSVAILAAFMAGGTANMEARTQFGTKVPTKQTADQEITRRIKPVGESTLPTLHSNSTKGDVVAAPPMRVTAGGTNLYGFIDATHEANRSIGLYEFTPDGLSQMWRSPLHTGYTYIELMPVYYRNDRICGMSPYYMWGMLWGMSYYEIDFKTGQLVTEEDDEEGLDVAMFYSCAYDSDTDTLYGYGTDDYGEDDEEAEVTAAYFLSAPAATPTKVTKVKDLGKKGFNDQCISMCYNRIDKKLYGITINNDFVTIDTKGNQTKLFHINMTNGAYISGMAYSATERLFYWNANYDNWTSGIYTINAETGEVALVQNFSNGDLFGCLAVVDEKVDGTTPMRPEYLSNTFKNGVTTGTVSYRMPTILADGSAITGDVSWTAYLDGGVAATGSAAPGSTVEVEFKNLSNNFHTFGMASEVGGKKSAVISNTFFIGFDTPMAPTNVQLQEGIVRWAPVSKGVNGGYVDQANLEYEVFLNGQSVGKTTKSSLSFTMPELPIQKFTASVVAICNGYQSPAGVSNWIVAGEPWTIPVDLVASEDTFDLMTIVNANGDEDTWWFNDYEQAFDSSYADDSNPDEWLFLPPVNFPDASQIYSFYISCKKLTTYYPEDYLEVMIGNYPDPDHMSQVVIPRFCPQSRDYKWFENLLLEVPSAGDWYIGLHATGAQKNQRGVQVNEIRIENNSIRPTSPGKVTDLTAIPADLGELKATVGFNLPTLDVAGNAIPAGTEVTASVIGDETVKVSGTPGQRLTAEVRTVQGDNTITVTTSIGDLNGASQTVDVYTGVVYPGSVRNLEAEVSADMMSMHLTWEAPAASTSVGYYDPNDVDYYFIEMDLSGGSYTKTLIGKGVLEYTYTLPAGAEQDVYTVGIQAANAAGDNGHYMRMQGIMGTPLQLPLLEKFDNPVTGFNNLPWITYSTPGSSSVWRIYALKDIATEFADMPGYALCGFSAKEENPDEAMIGLPRFSTKGMSDVLCRFRYWTGDESASVRIMGAIHSKSEPEALYRMPVGDDWEWVEFRLKPEYMGQDWVQLYIEAKYRPADEVNYCFVNEIQITNISGVGSVTSTEGRVVGLKGRVVVADMEGADVAVYTTDGRTAALRSDISVAESIELERGIYVVKVNNECFKVVVK